MKMPNYGSNTRWFVNNNGEVSVEVAGVTYGPGGTTQTLLQPGDKANGNTNYTVDGKTAMIPNGFYISTVPEEQSIDGGLVVVAPDASEFVWVPVDNVDNVDAMFETHDGRLVGNLTEYSKDGSKDGTKITYSGLGFREPDKLTDTTNGDTEANIAKMKNILNLPSDKELKTGDDLKNFMQEDVDTMHESIQKNKGFYIGRYETGDLSKDQVVSNAGNLDISGTDQNIITWYTMYAKQKRFGDQLGTGIKSSMIYGSQWDTVMKWFAIDTDTEIAKYVTNAEGKGNKNGELESTGYYLVKNIFDMAGNVYDWTAEANSSDFRVLRGGNYSRSTGSPCAGARNYHGPAYSSRDCGTRLALYL